MSAAEMIAGLPNLSVAERRLAGAIFDLENEAEFLRGCVKRTDERFEVLDAMETDDGSTTTG